jgi:hypothetical protein
MRIRKVPAKELKKTRVLGVYQQAQGYAPIPVSVVESRRPIVVQTPSFPWIEEPGQGTCLETQAG